MGENFNVASQRTSAATFHLSESELLTQREIEVLRHLRLRRKPKEIAHLLCLSEATVRTHIRNAIRGLGVHGARAAVRAAFDMGLLDSVSSAEPFDCADEHVSQLYP